MTSAPSFRLLPVEATEAMQANGRDAIQPWLPQGRVSKPVTDQWQIAREVWSSMVSAAPVMAEATDEMVDRAMPFFEGYPLTRDYIKAAINAALAIAAGHGG